VPATFDKGIMTLAGDDSVLEGADDSVSECEFEGRSPTFQLES